MNCPKCNGSMEKVKIQSIEVDRCTKCKGIWFDLLEQEDLKKISDSEMIDTGDPKVGEKFNPQSNINCPVCKTKMIRMVDLKQHHIWYEGCKVCNGVFFDAGEFKDYKEESVLDLFKNLFMKTRK